MSDGSIAWMLVSTALVLFMVPGLALFYGGMVRSKNVVNMVMMNLYCLGSVSVAWVVIGYTLGNSGHGGIIGNLDNIGLRGIQSAEDLIGVAFFMTFAVITPALISGAVADRMKFRAWMIFVPVWSILVYCPVTYWVYSGWMESWGVLDFAGGTAIHINAGIAALALVLVLRKRRGWPRDHHPPHNPVLVTLGAGILWFGWFGFNAGSAGAADEVAARAVVNTLVAGGAGMLGWIVVERLRDHRITSIGAASGVVAALVAITPAAGFVGGLTPVLLGVVAGVVCFLAIQLKFKFGYDDSLDVVGVHLVGGIVGGVLLGLFADPDTFSEAAGVDFAAGALLGGGWGGGALIWDQLVSMGAVLLYSFVATLIIGVVLNRLVGLRVREETEVVGLDIAQHAERAYVL